jgi:hypothetical protein
MYRSETFLLLYPPCRSCHNVSEAGVQVKEGQVPHMLGPTLTLATAGVPTV